MAMVTRNKCITAAVLAVVALGAAACTPHDLESPPVKVSTPKGDVVCQLYTRSVLDWDRAIKVPAGMSAETADGICRNRGIEWKETGK